MGEYQRKIAEETVAIVTIGSYKVDEKEIDLKEDISKMLEGTIICFNNSKYPLCNKMKFSMEDMQLTDEDSLSCAMRLQKEGYDVTVLNFASAKNIGGGFLKGSNAQEENIMRNTTAYKSLLEKGREYYNINRRNLNRGLYNDVLIYSPNVRIIRDDRDKLIENEETINIITCPAPFRKAALRNRIPEATICEVMNKRINMILDAFLAQADEKSVLVLGAFGCGVFMNEPDVVASLFTGAITERRNSGKLSTGVKFVFPIPNRGRTGSRNYNEFKRIFLSCM